MQQQIFRTAALAAWASVAAAGIATAQAPAPAEPAAQGAPAAKGDPAKAKAVLEAVAKAMGGDKLAALKSFTAEGEYRQALGEREMSGGIEMAGLMPDGFQVSRQFMRPDGMAGPSMVQTIKGTEAFRDMVGGGGNMMMRFGGPGGPGGGPGGPGGGPGGPGNRMDPSVMIKADLYRTLLGILPTSPVLSALTFSHIAEAESPNGVADVIDITGPDNFRARLFVEQAEHRPLMLSYMMRQPRMMTRPANMPQFKNDEERRAYFEEQRKKFEAEPPPPLVEANVFFTDFRKVDGITLPHKITRQVEGKVQEEWTIEKYKLNAPIKPEQFQKKASN
ncbi:MAG TPA: hypothetical protein VMF13_16325 [Luteitalea sp.]|nr:hypothetical protein [Luteitalea sp.]